MVMPVLILTDAQAGDERDDVHADGISGLTGTQCGVGAGRSGWGC